MLTRRGLLTAAVLGALTTSGCVRRDPTVAPRPSAVPLTPDTTPAPLDLAHHAALQAALAAAAQAGRPDTERLGALRQRAARDLAAQAELLAAGVSAPAAGGDFSAACRAAAEDHLAAEATGTTAARLASAGAYAAAVGSLAGAATPHLPTEAPSADELPVTGDAVAMTGLLLQLHVAVFTLETMLPLLSGEDEAWARTTLEGQVAARTALESELASRSLAVPPPEVAYDVGRPTGAGEALALVASVEQAVLPQACLLVRAAEEPALRRLGGSVLHDATIAVARAGGALPAWPGWS